MPHPRWYVQSRGTGLRQDYTWTAVAAGARTADGAELARVRAHTWKGLTLGDLADDDHPGMVLAHAQALGTVVYVTGLRPGDPQPLDPQGRAIRAAVLGLARPGTDPRPVWQIAIAALDGRLDARLGLRFDGDADPGYSLDPRDWEDLLAATAVAGGSGPSRPPARDCVVVRDDGPERERVARDMADLLRQGLHVQLKDTVIVLRRPRTDPSRITSVAPWRALTQLEQGSAVPRPDPLDLLGRAGRQAAGGLQGIVKILPWPLVLGVAATLGVLAVVALWPTR